MAYPTFADDSAAISAYLNPVYMKKEVLVQYLFDPAYTCVFCSETYGTIRTDDWDLPLGLNPNGKVIAWRGDIEELPLDEQLYIASKLADSDGDLRSEFYDAQVNAEFTSPLPAVQVYLDARRLAKLLEAKFGGRLLHPPGMNVDDVLELCSKHKRLLFGERDELKPVVGELHELLIEGLRKAEIRSALNGLSVPYGEDLGSLKLFERLATHHDASVSVSSFFHLNDFRIWARHRGETKWETGTAALGLPASTEPQRVYDDLVKQLSQTLTALIGVFSQ